MRPGLKILEDSPGEGEELQRKKTYFFKLEMELSRGDKISWPFPSGIVDRARLENNGTILFTDMRFDRECMINGIFYGIEGMRIGGTRKLKISPHLAYGENGIEGVVPQNAVIYVTIHAIEERTW